MRYPCALIVLSFALMPVAAQPPAWVTVKGQVVLPANVVIPQPAKLDVNEKACLAKGPLLDEKIIVNGKNRGLRNVVVWLRPGDPNPAVKFNAKDIHPADAKRKPADVVIDQPCCVFTPRITLARVGDTIVVKNPAAFAHNFFWASAENGDLNVTIPANMNYKFQKPLVLESSAIPYKCTIHPWMQGYVRVFDHPYFALTDADGKFEIKNAPAGNYRIVYWHESVGFLGGKAGRAGAPIAIAGGANDTMEMKPIDFDVK